MRIHFISCGAAVPLAYHCQLAGHKVIVHLRGLACGEGLFPIVPQPEFEDIPELVIVDGVGWGTVLDAFGNDSRVLFGGKAIELLLTDEKYHEAVLRKAGVQQSKKQPRFEAFVGAWHEGGLHTPYFAGAARNRLFSGDIGPSVGCMGAEITPIESSNHLLKRYVHPFLPFLEGIKYAGLVSAHFVPEPNGAVIRLQLGIHLPIITALSETCYGGFPALISPSHATTGGQCAVSIMLSLPPWPYGAPGQEERQPFALDEPEPKHFWPIDVVRPDGNWQYAAQLGILGTATGRGEKQTDSHTGAELSFREARRRANRTARNINLPNLQYRDDIGFRGDDVLELFEKMTSDG